MDYATEKIYREVYRDFRDHGASFEAMEVKTLYGKDEFVFEFPVLFAHEEEGDSEWCISRIIERLSFRNEVGIGVRLGNRLVALNVQTEKRKGEMDEMTWGQDETLRVSGPAFGGQRVNETFVFRVSEKSPMVGKAFAGMTLITGDDFIPGPGCRTKLGLGEWYSNGKRIQVLPQEVRNWIRDLRTI